MHAKPITWMLTGLCALLAFTACNKEDDSLDTKARVTCIVGEAGSAMLGETVTVNAYNISANTTVTVKFGREKVVTRTGPGSVSYAFETSGLKSIRVSLSPSEVEKTVWLVDVQALESIQSLAKKLKADPDLCLVMCHRANSSDWTIPENSLSAVKKCIADKVDIVEMDLYTTKDGVLVVSHDPTINRVTNGTGSIKNLTLAQIKSYNLKDRNGDLTTETMPTFDEFLEQCKGYIYIDVDLGDRDADVSKVVQAITKKGMIQQCFVYCNDADKIAAAYRTNPECNVYTWTNAGNRNAMIEGGIPGNTYFTQASYYPQSAATSASGQPSENSCTSSAWVAESAAAGTITTINAIYTTDTKSFYKKDFKVEQVKELFEFFPSCQCIHVDTGAEARAALINFGKHVR